MAAGDLYVGVDIGSATVKVVGIDAAAEVRGEPVYLRHDEFARQEDAVKEALQRYLQSTGGSVAGIATTGSGRELSRKLLGADLAHTEIFAHAVGISHLVQKGDVVDDEGLPVKRLGTVIEIGGQDSKVIVFGEDGLPAHFNMNTICAAGTGEFLKQLADEAGATLEQCGEIALQSTRAVTIDATCTVFAKRDFRHLTQKGVTLADRLMGACRAMVRNYLTNVVRGSRLPAPILFQGGVALNPAVRKAFAEHLKSRVVVPPHSATVGALGMAVLVRAAMTGAPDSATGFRADFFTRQLRSRIRYCHGCHNACDLAQPYEERGGQVVVVETLGGRCDGCQEPRNVREQPKETQVLRIPVVRAPAPTQALRLLSSHAGLRCPVGHYFAGLDGGSRGTKYALIKSLEPGRQAPDIEIIAAGTIDTAGDAIAACRQALSYLQRALPSGAALEAIGTTGSAGELFRDIITTRSSRTADERCTEIVAHYVWASYWRPEVATVMDIGGNDAKLITVRDGGLDFAMNEKCAAGTGAFLEAVARRFRIAIEDYGDVALQSNHPARIAGRCAVFGESDIVHKARLGFATPDLFLGLAFAVCRTYLSDLGRGTIRIPIVAQGGAFLNKAVQHAFRETLDLGSDEFVVSPQPHHVLCAGALGASLLARARWQQGYASHFKGFANILDSEYHTVTATCSHRSCPRRCQEVVALLENGVPIAGYKAIDCARGYFSGLAGDGEHKRHMQRVLDKSRHATVGGA
jgi:predicted CoA-substrate-specific enzyme activase